MRVRMTVQITGHRNDAPWPARGGEIVVPDDEGAALCAAGIAVPVAVTNAAETATAPAAETRAPRRARSKAV